MRAQSEYKPKTRIIIMLSIVLLIGVLFGLKLVQLQVVDGEEFYNKAFSNSSLTSTVSAARGVIVDRNGVELASNIPLKNVILDKNMLPALRQDQYEIVIKVVDILNDQEETVNISIPIKIENTGENDESVYVFESDRENEVMSLRARMGLQDWATADNVMTALSDYYDLEDYSKEEALVIAGIYLEMETRGFNYSTPFVIADDVSNETVARIKESSFDIPGADIAEEAQRYYPLGDVAPHIIGRVGPIPSESLEYYEEKEYSRDSIVGIEGIELALEDSLYGKDGERTISRDSMGNITDSTISVEPQAGNTVVLTIDAQLQQYAEERLASYHDSIKAMNLPNEGADVEGGALVVIDPDTGEVLASANFPNYDLNDYIENYSEYLNDELNPLYNRATRGVYNPGSSFKPIVALGGLTEGVVTEDTYIGCSGTYNYWAPSYTPTCMFVHGNQNVIDALKVSCNIYFYETGRLLGIDEMGSYARDLGFGSSTGIEIPESLGSIASPEYKESIGLEWQAGDVVQAAIGYDYNRATPMQLAAYTAALANDGVRVNAHLVKDITTHDSEEIVFSTQTTVLSETTASDEAKDIVEQGMLAASLSGGTASAAFGDYVFPVYSKTGTAGLLANKSPDATFICYGGPSEDDQIAIAIVMESGGHGSYLAPLAKEIFDYYYFDEKVTDTDSDNDDSQTPQNDEDTDLPLDNTDD